MFVGTSDTNLEHINQYLDHRIKNIFGNIVDEIYCPQSGITIGRSSNPVAQAGDRILHLGILKKADEALASEAKENY